MFRDKYGYFWASCICSIVDTPVPHSILAAVISYLPKAVAASTDIPYPVLGNCLANTPFKVKVIAGFDVLI